MYLGPPARPHPTRRPADAHANARARTVPCTALVRRRGLVLDAAIYRNHPANPPPHVLLVGRHQRLAGLLARASGPSGVTCVGNMHICMHTRMYIRTYIWHVKLPSRPLSMRPARRGSRQMYMHMCMHMHVHMCMPPLSMRPARGGSRPCSSCHTSRRGVNAAKSGDQAALAVMLQLPCCS